MKQKKALDAKANRPLTVAQMKEATLNKIPIEERMELDAKVKSYLVGKLIREKRIEAGLTQEELASRIDARKGFISRIENGYVDPQLSTLYRILEEGIGLKMKLDFEDSPQKG